MMDDDRLLDMARAGVKLTDVQRHRVIEILVQETRSLCARLDRLETRFFDADQLEEVRITNQIYKEWVPYSKRKALEDI